jgi:hypothetical protein
MYSTLFAALLMAQAENPPVALVDEPPAAQTAPRPDKDTAEAIRQELCYRALAQWAEANPRRVVLVYVQADPPTDGSDYVEEHCRYDRGWPDITVPTKILAWHDGKAFVELQRQPIRRQAGVMYGQEGLSLAAAPAARSWAKSPVFRPPAGQATIGQFRPFTQRPLLGRPLFGRFRAGACGPGGCN